MNIADLQQAIYTRLTSVVAITSAVTGVFTTRPQPSDAGDNTAFPYITIGPIIPGPYDTKDDNGGNVLFDVHIWSRSQSALDWRAIGDLVYDALQKYDALAVAGANVIDVRFDSSQDFQDPDEGETWHYVLTFRATYFLT